MTIITCIVMSEPLLKDDDRFADEDDEIQFETLHQLWTTNHLIVKEFAQYLNETLLFPNASGPDDDQEAVRAGGKRLRRPAAYDRNPKKYLMLKEF